MKLLYETLNSLFEKGPTLSGANSSVIGNSLMLIPHPDDESLACGGTIALLRENGFSVHIIIVTDGSMSHPSSESYPPERLRILREEEVKKALDILGVSSDAIRFLRLPDSKMDKLDITTFQKNSKLLQEYILEIKPVTIFLPWRNDPHPDHIATWKLSMDAIKSLYRKDNFQIRILEYPVWFWERTDVSELTHGEGVSLWKVKIENKLASKERAIAQHASQLGEVIKDDPKGFTLSDEMLMHFSYPEELFFEYH